METKNEGAAPPRAPRHTEAELNELRLMMSPALVAGSELAIDVRRLVDEVLSHRRFRASIDAALRENQ